MRDHELKVFAFDREQLSLLRRALISHRRYFIGKDREIIERWIEAFAPDEEDS